jgi:DNA-binding response OmpR family regulator
VKRILIVDDQYAAARLVVALLKLDGYNAEHVPDWRNIIQEIEQKKPDLIILDVHLPDVDGFEILHDIRAHPNATVSAVPVLLISALDYGYKTAQSRASGFLLKPFNHQHLLDAIQKIEENEQVSAAGEEVSLSNNS